jgi:hypothetical protein
MAVVSRFIAGLTSRIRKLLFPLPEKFIPKPTPCMAGGLVQTVGGLGLLQHRWIARHDVRIFGG